jgi:hypothetical protein
VTRCPACLTRDKGQGKYLCYDCWHLLPLRARRALKRQDTRTYARLEELYDQIHRSVPLPQIEVTP